MATEAEIIQAGQVLLEKKRQEANRKRESTLTLVKNSLRSDLTAAISAAKELEGAPEYAEAVKVLEGQSKPSDVCPECQSPLPVRFSQSSLKYIVSRCFVCEENRREQKQQAEKKRVKQKFMNDLPLHLESCGFPKRFLKARIEDAPPPYCNLKPSEVKSLYVYGERGVGKSHLVCALARHIVEGMEPRIVNSGIVESVQMPMNSFPLFVGVPRLLMEIRDSFKEKSETSEKKIIEKYTTRPIQIFDDLGKGTASEWVQQTLYVLINQRYEDEQITLITSEYSLDQLADKVGDAVASRITEMCEVKKLTGEDRRLKR